MEDLAMMLDNERYFFIGILFNQAALTLAE